MSEPRLPSAARALWVTGRIAFRASPWLAVGSLMIPMGWLQGQVEAVLTRSAVDGVASHRLEAAAIAIGALLCVRAGWEVFDVVGHRSVSAWQDRAGVEFERQLALASARLPGLAEFEDPAHVDLLHLLRSDEGVWRLHWTFESLMEALGALVRVVITSVLLASLDPWLLLLPLAGLPALWAGMSSARLLRDAEIRTAQEDRRRRHLFDLATAPGPAKEVRVAQLGAFLRAKAAAAWREVDCVYRRVQRRTSLQDAAGALFVSAAFVGAVLLMLDRARHGQATVGAVLMTVMLAGDSAGSGLAMLVHMVSWTLDNLGVSQRFVWLLDRAPVETAAARAAPLKIARGISLRDLSFAYAPSLPPALDHVSLDLPAGSVVAVVGENGAGKSSLVKLLCRLYEPSGGSIEVDGTDLSTIDREGWRCRIAAGFQDFCRFELLLRESAGVGDLMKMKDATKVTGALEEAGALRVVSRLANGLEHQLGIRWPDGADLSTGEWQKVALARLLMRSDPLLIVLDEPTASLDAPTEAALFESYAEVARAASRRTGAITVLVSHRFSTVRIADLIVVLDQGRIAELGTHEELLDAGGAYSSLVGLQRRLHGG